MTLTALLASITLSLHAFAAPPGIATAREVRECQANCDAWYAPVQPELTYCYSYCTVSGQR